MFDYVVCVCVQSGPRRRQLRYDSSEWEDLPPCSFFGGRPRTGAVRGPYPALCPAAVSALGGLAKLSMGDDGPLFPPRSSSVPSIVRATGLLYGIILDYVCLALPACARFCVS